MTLYLRLLMLVATAFLASCASRTSVHSSKPLPAAHTHYSAANDVLMRAISLVGTPYVSGGNTPQTGFDCSGLIKYVYHEAAGINLPRTTREMISINSPNVGLGALHSGDLVFFATGKNRRVSHAGIYVGDGRFVHAPRTGGVVRLESLGKPYWQKAFLQAKRVIDEGPLISSR